MSRTVRRASRWFHVLVVAFSTLAASAPSRAAADDKEKRVLRGILQHASGPDGSAAWTIHLDRPMQWNSGELKDIEIRGKVGQSDRLQDKYVEVIGHVEDAEPHPHAIVNVSSLRKVETNGEAEAELSTVSLKLSLTPSPMRLNAKTKAGPTINFFTRNLTHRDLALDIQFAGRHCFTVRNAETGKITLKIEPDPIPKPQRFIITADSADWQLFPLPLEATPAPGIYIIEAGYCGYDAYTLTARFVVRGD